MNSRGKHEPVLLFFPVYYGYDAQERPAGYALSVDGTNRATVAYGYDAAGRIATLSITNSAGRALSVAYTNTGLYNVGYAVTLPGGNVFRREVRRDPSFPDRITTCSNFFDSAAMTGFVYHYDLAGRPTTLGDISWGPDLSGTLQGAGGVGGLVAVSIDGQYYFPCYDNNGNIVAYVDESGVKVASYTYDAFGNILSSSGAMRYDFHYLFSTKYQDPSTWLYDFGYRWYFPEIGRWLNRDPIEEEGGENLYVCCGNATTMYIDCLGNQWKITRNGSMYASAECICDNVFSLSRIIGLSVSEYRFWLTTQNGEDLPLTPYMKIKSQTFLIPNTIYAYWAGDMGEIGKLWVNWNSNISYLSSLGFRVIEYKNVKGAQHLSVQHGLENASISRVLHGVYYWGHGYGPYPSDGLTDSIGTAHIYYIGVQRFNKPSMTPISLSYKLALGLVFACDSNSGKSTLLSSSSGAIWKGFSGTLYPIFPRVYGISGIIKPGMQGTK